MKTLINKKTIGNKHYLSTNSLSSYDDNVKVKVLESSEYRTNGENLILVKNVLSSKIILDSTTTTSITIKTLTNTIIKPFIGKIDEEYDEILLNKGASVEFYNINGNWYILSSDGLKLDN
jgi:hypothetical protein